MRAVLVLAAQRAPVRERHGCGFNTGIAEGSGNDDDVVVWTISASRAVGHGCDRGVVDLAGASEPTDEATAGPPARCWEGFDLGQGGWLVRACHWACRCLGTCVSPNALASTSQPTAVVAYRNSLSRPERAAALDGDPPRWPPGTTVEPGTVRAWAYLSRGRGGA